MATDQPKEKTTLLSDLEKSALAQAEQPSEQGWYPDPLRAGEGTERFFSTELGQWTGRTRGDYKAPKRDLSQSVGSVSVSAEEIQASALIRDIDIKQLTDDEAVWSYLIGKQVFANILDPDEWSIAILAQVTKSFLIFQVDGDKGRYPLMWRHEYVRALDVRHRQWNTGYREVRAFKTIDHPGKDFEVFGRIELVHHTSVVVQNEKGRRTSGGFVGMSGPIGE